MAIANWMLDLPRTDFRRTIRETDVFEAGRIVPLMIQLIAISRRNNNDQPTSTISFFGVPRARVVQSAANVNVHETWDPVF